MKNPILLSSVLACFSLLTIESQAQTTISSGIYADETWTEANSPYLVTADITVFPDVTLTLEPGVMIKFSDGVALEIRGILNSQGSAAKPVKLMAASNTPKKDSWLGIRINNYDNSKVSMQYTEVQHAQQAIYNNAELIMTNCSFFNNLRVLYNTPSVKTIIESCLFRDSDAGVAGQNMEVSNCRFMHNGWGAHQVSNTVLRDNQFCDNYVAVEGYSGELTNNIIMNNRIGVISHVQGFGVIDGNIIAANDTGFMFSKDHVAKVSMSNTNQVCNSVLYHFVNESDKNITLPDICFCGTGASNLAQKVFDGHDDNAYGLLSIQAASGCDPLPLPEEPCGSVPAFVQKPELSTTLSVYPNPAGNTFIVTSSIVLTQADIRLINAMGQEVLWLTNLSGSEFHVFCDALPQGVYLLTMVQDGKPVGTLRLAIE